MDFSVPSFSLGVDLDDDPPPPAGSGGPERARVYAAPDAPSFSLGIESDEDGGGGGASLPAGVRREGPERRYDAPDAPSFSLGIDDSDDELLPGGQRHERAQPPPAPRAPSSTGVEEEEEEEDFALAGGKRSAPMGRETLDPDPLPPPPEATRFKRLRRGPAPPQPAPAPHVRRYEAPDAPSFSLGIDDDDDDDFLAGAQHHEQSRPPAAPRAPTQPIVLEEEDDFFLADPRRPERVPLAAPAPGMSQLKRLRRRCVLPRPASTPPPRLPEQTPAGASPLVCAKAAQEAAWGFSDEIQNSTDTPPPKVPEPTLAEASPLLSGMASLGAAVGSFEDEIEDFTDEEPPKRDVPPSVGSCSTSSNSKFSLLNRGVLMSQSAPKANISKFAQVSNSSASKSLEESCTKKLLPKITVSPMRKIHLLDSDTDAEDDQNQSKAKKTISPLKKRQESMNKYMQKEPTLQQTSKSQGSTTVHNSKAMMSDHWATPALDDFCNEYFKSVKDSGPSQKESSSGCRSKISQRNTIGEVEGHFQHQSTSSGSVLDDNLTDSSVPAMHYFFHHDPRVRDLVRERLQYFFPTGAESTRENEQSRPESLGHRRQSSSNGAANDGWVTPNSRISVPTDVGKRRVHAHGTQSGSGHWFTGEHGRKCGCISGAFGSVFNSSSCCFECSVLARSAAAVTKQAAKRAMNLCFTVYISKNGQELTGQAAYRQYKKESGKGRQKYGKKGSSAAKRGSGRAAKTTAAANRGTSRAKRKR
ncbi:hypothetical protein ACP4OV_025629 [Aristida adscensionis]